jgi:hypothetical protein
MKKYVQTLIKLYCTFCKSMGHDDRDCRDYDLMHKRSRDIYKIQGKVQQEGHTTHYNSPGRGNFNPFYGSRSRINHLLQLCTTRTPSKGLSEPLHYLQLLQFL